jgi:DNA-directed RNA polymerase subunit RPC12/RpoP
MWRPLSVVAAGENISSKSESEKIMEPKGNVPYVYRCAECGHRGEQRLADDSHDGAESNCSVCGATVTLEWDGGVTIDSLINIARRWREENGYVGRGWRDRAVRR